MPLTKIDFNFDILYIALTYNVVNLLHLKVCVCNHIKCHLL
jgi:hypothetical protein